LVFAVTIGAVAGALYSLIIPFAIDGIQRRTDNSKELETSSLNLDFVIGNEAIIFFSVVTLILLTKALSVILVNNIAKSATAELKIVIAKKINKMKIDNVENVGFPRLLTILTDDVNHVSQAAIAIPMIVVSMVTIIGMLGYLAFLNFMMFGIVLATIFVGVFLFQVPVAMVQGLYNKARDLKDTIQEGVRGLVFGAFELKLNENKSNCYIDEEIITPQSKSVKLEKIGDMIIHLAGNSSELLSFFIIGMVVFIMPHYIQLPAAESFGVVMALLYIAGPVASILGMLQHLNMGHVALIRIHTIEGFEEEEYSDISALKNGWKEYRVENITYQYETNDQNSAFALNPICLSFEPGQINFIVGGNGSGKSTLSKLLSLHYTAATGAIYFDNIVINDANIGQSRERISVIYSHYYLFAKLYREYSIMDVMRINSYLEALGLTGKTEFVDGKFSTTKLSDGQRRRLALLVSLLEDKDIYIFDEWAADQDPQFKRVFYHEILPNMKADNKLVIVITHDDRYFDCADRIIFMEEGNVVDIESNNNSESDKVDYSLSCSEHSIAEVSL